MFYISWNVKMPVKYPNLIGFCDIDRGGVILKTIVTLLVGILEKVTNRKTVTLPTCETEYISLAATM